MNPCETCGNTYDHPMSIRLKGNEHWFDCFECAIHALAPRCASCGVPVLGHGVEVDDTVFCSAHCGRIQGDRELRDHIWEAKYDSHQGV